MLQKVFYIQIKIFLKYSLNYFSLQQKLIKDVTKKKSNLDDTGKMADTLIKLGEKDALKSVREDVDGTRRTLEELGAKIEERKQTMQVS